MKLSIFSQSHETSQLFHKDWEERKNYTHCSLDVRETRILKLGLAAARYPQNIIENRAQRPYFTYNIRYLCQGFQFFPRMWENTYFSNNCKWDQKKFFLTFVGIQMECLVIFNSLVSSWSLQHVIPLLLWRQKNPKTPLGK